MKTRIYGASDDLIEIDGAISDEVNVYLKDGEKVKISASDGTNATIEYDDNGEWKIEVLDAGNKCQKKIVSVGDEAQHGGEAKGTTSYSDVLIFEDGIEWIKIGKKTFKP